MASRDEKTGENSAQKVVRAFVRRASQTLRLRFGSETIETTGEHPFYVPGRGFVPAKLLATGALVASLGGQPQTLAAAQWGEREKTVYNFEVANTHTYFVGQSGVWVHNAKCAKWGRIVEEWTERKIKRPNGSTWTDLDIVEDVSGLGNNGLYQVFEVKQWDNISNLQSNLDSLTHQIEEQFEALMSQAPTVPAPLRDSKNLLNGRVQVGVWMQGKEAAKQQVQAQTIKAMNELEKKLRTKYKSSDITLCYRFGGKMQ